MKVDLIYINRVGRWRGAGQACCAGFIVQERDEGGHDADLTGDDWLAGYRGENVLN